MFLPVSTEKLPDRPANSQISNSDWDALARFWHPVAALPEIAENTPFKVTLLDTDLVLYRSGGKITVALDRCPHRWVRLSAGKVSEGNLICAFHGLTFDGSGQCVRVPALGDRPAKIPTSYRLRTFRCEVRYGMVWVCLDDRSTESLPHFDCFVGYDESAIFFLQVREWPMSAARQIENFIDLGHLPWVHATTLGGDPFGRMRPAAIKHDDKSVTMSAQFVETVPFDRPTECELIYRVTLPFAIDFSTTPEGGKGFRSLNIASPTSWNRCRVFQAGTRGAPGETFRDGPKIMESISDVAQLLTKQDIDMLEQLVIQEMPLTEKLEIHLPVDNVSIAYRERLRALGLGR
jgi:phenylpropionate dioxygenase-like ring-hydroxylating dioxygenase large terminal subunit